MTSAREIYWICKQPSEMVRSKIQILQKYQIKTRLLPDFQTLVRAYAETRLSTVIVGDEGADDSLISNMQKLSNHPEFAGVRLILSISSSNPLLADYAANLGFRDIIAVDLAEEQWLRRYVFASSGKPTDLKDPHPLISARSLAAVRVPARVSWMTEKELWLETRLNPPVGTTLALGGGIADFLGVKQIGIKVKEYHKTNLHFRYSEAMLCAWDIPKSMQDRKSVLKEFFKAQKFTPPYRFYAIIRNHDLRKSIVKGLSPARFEVTVALNKNNMIHEPRFITPDAVLIEDRLCIGAYQENFLSMAQTLDPSTPIFVLGNGVVPELANHRMIRVGVLPLNMETYFEKELGAPKQIRSGMMPIAKSHPLSFAQIIMSGRLSQVHPEGLEVALAYPLGRFGIFTVESPLFQQTVGHPVHCKVVRNHESRHGSGWKEYPHHAQAIIVDLLGNERKTLGARLVQLFSEQLGVSLSQVPEMKAPAAAEAKASPAGPAETAPDRKAPSPAETALMAFEDSIPTVPKGKAAPAPIENPMTAEALHLAPNVDIGPGPMRTEFARSLHSSHDSDDPVLTATELIPLRGEVAIPQSEEMITTHPLDRIVEDIRGIPKEWKFVAYALLAMAILLALTYFLRSPQEDQAPLFTEQLRIFQKEHNGGPKDPQPSSPGDSDTPGEAFWK